MILSNIKDFATQLLHTVLRYLEVSEPLEALEKASQLLRLLPLFADHKYRG